MRVRVKLRRRRRAWRLRRLDRRASASRERRACLLRNPPCGRKASNCGSRFAIAASRLGASIARFSPSLVRRRPIGEAASMPRRSLARSLRAGRRARPRIRGRSRAPAARRGRQTSTSERPRPRSGAESGTPSLASTGGSMSLPLLPDGKAARRTPAAPGRRATGEQARYRGRISRTGAAQSSPTS